MSQQSLGDEKPKIRHDWYQTESAVVITVLIKNVKNEHLKVDFQNSQVTLSIKGYDDEDLELKYNLEHEIDSKQCNYRITPSKIEVKLTKKEGIRWSNLEKVAEKVKEPPKPTQYPTSMGKDWAAIEKDIEKEEATEKPEGEEALNKLFQEIYGQGTDEVKRAMNKSFIESGGTVLSTNWKEIAEKKVDVKPPDGLEWKKW